MTLDEEASADFSGYLGFDLASLEPFYETKLNKYKLLVTIGQDEALPTSAVDVSLVGFADWMGYDAPTIELFRQATIAWFLERFGVDFTSGYYDPTTGITSISYANLIPLSFSGNYRVLASNNPAIPWEPVENPTFVRLAEFVCEFNDNAVGLYYGGTYALDNPAPVPIQVSDNLAEGTYRFFVPQGHHNVKRSYLFFMRSYYPNGGGPNSTTPPQSVERFQLLSPNWGPGFGELNVGVPLAPGADGKYDTFVRATWSFPGSFEIPAFNGFTVPPIPINLSQYSEPHFPRCPCQ